MTTAPPHSTVSTAPNAASLGAKPDGAGYPKGLLFDLASIDLSQRIMDRPQIEAWLPHRGEMLQVDAVVWHAPDFKQGVGLKRIRDDEFWVPGHFPGRPMLPGVLQVEAAAQLAVILYNRRLTEPLTAAFTRIDDCSFRHMVVPGDELYLLCQEVKWSRRGFTCHVQGMTNRKLTFDAHIQGLAV